MSSARHWLSRTTVVGLTVVLSALMLAPAGAAPAGAAPAARALTMSAEAHGLDPGLALRGDSPESVIVTGTPGIVAAVGRHGGQVAETLPIVSGVVATVPAVQVRALAAESAVRSVTANRTASFADFTYDASSTASNFARTTQATDAWATGDLGQGVGVAVIDTGVSPMPDLADHTVHGPDLSGEGTTIDGYGHGTVMAGLIAGSGFDSQNRSHGAYTGVAPAAHIVAVKVAGRNGVVDVSTILQAMSWVNAYKDQFNIRVLNLSWGVDSTQDPAVDPLNYAVERLWSAGVVVVVAAGNEGPANGTITKPADDPAVLTVGAFYDRGDNSPGNDTIPSWSSRGPTATGLNKPDVVAPGRTLVATRSFGSYVDVQNPYSRITPSYIKGSGTSQAAAVTSGVVALLLAARPELTPDQVKDVLTATASPLYGVPAATQGAGRVQVADALAATPTAPPQALPATGLGSLEASRGGVDVQTDCDGTSTVITGEIDVRCQQWDPQAWTTAPWDGTAWTGVSWKGAEWDGVSWKDVGWADANWDGVSWKGGTWTSESWQGSSSWNGSAGGAWTGVSWKDSTWTGVSWKDASWTTAGWTTGEYDDEFATAFWGPQPRAGHHVRGEKYTPTPAEVRKAEEQQTPANG